MPVLWVAWNLVLNHLSGPHYLSRSDPEYVYLLNGLNAAMVQFDRIGHVDHPGTPFQLITGVFIALIHAASGSGTMAEDVITSPEKYLFLSSFFLSLITAGLFYRISRQEFRRSSSLTGALLIPASILLYSVVIDLPSRYIPDRLLMIILLGFAALGINYLHHGYSRKKFILFSALLMAMGVVTKINFLPFLVLPLFFLEGWKGRISYTAYLGLFTILFFLPVHKKFMDFWQFAMQVSTHDGLYGGGSDKMLDPVAFIRNLGLIVKDNPAFGAIFLLAAGTLALLLSRSSWRREFGAENRLLAGFVAVSVMMSVIVAKHYKNYYMIPALIYSGFALYVLRGIAVRAGLTRYFTILVLAGGLFVLVLNGLYLVPGYGHRIERNTREMLAGQAMGQLIGTGDYLLVEPTWMAGPTPVNGLVYGISYIAHRHYFFDDYEKVYPDVITYEGTDRPLRFFRLLEASNESILKSGKDIYLLSSPGRNAPDIARYLDSCAAGYGVMLRADTVFSDPMIDYSLLRINNLNGWTTTTEVRYGYETVIEGALLDDRGMNPLRGPTEQVSGSAGKGSHSLALGGQARSTPAFVLPGIRQGDLIEWTIKRNRGAEADDGELTASYTGNDGEKRIMTARERLSSIHPRWELVRLTMTVDEQPADSTVTGQYIFHGEGRQVVDDFSVRHMTVKGRGMEQR